MQSQIRLQLLFKHPFLCSQVKENKRKSEKGRYKLFKLDIITKQAKINVVFLANADRLIGIA